MQLGIQFNGNVPANATRRWSTHSWSAALNVVWMMAPTGPVENGSPQVEWKVQNARQDDRLVTWFIEVTNLTAEPISFEARYAILNG